MSLKLSTSKTYWHTLSPRRFATLGTTLICNLRKFKNLWATLNWALLIVDLYLQVILRSPHGSQGCAGVHLANNAVDVVDEVSNASLRGLVIRQIFFHLVVEWVHCTFFSVETTDVNEQDALAVMPVFIFLGNQNRKFQELNLLTRLFSRN